MVESTVWPLNGPVSAACRQLPQSLREERTDGCFAERSGEQSPVAVMSSPSVNKLLIGLSALSVQVGDEGAHRMQNAQVTCGGLVSSSITGGKASSVSEGRQLRFVLPLSSFASDHATSRKLKMSLKIPCGIPSQLSTVSTHKVPLNAEI